MQAVAERQQRELVAQRKEADFEAYQRYESERRLWDEVTDVAERVRAPISHADHFTLTTEGLVSKRGEHLRPVIERGLQEAKRQALINPDWEVEVERCSIDLEEYDELETLALEGEGAGAIVSYWLIPDAVKNGPSTLPGYNRQRLKMFTRIAAPTATGLAIKYHSYDGSYLPGVQAMDARLGFTFDPSRGSEQIARERRRIDVPVESVDDLDELLRQAYDGVMQRDFGGEWDGGRRPLPVRNVIEYIKSQHDLLGAHMSELSKIFALTTDPHERNRLMEPHRYNLAAAIDDLLHGKPVTSAGDAGDNARAEGRNLEGDCPIGSDNITAQQLESLGFKVAKKETLPSIWAVGECVACLYKTAVAVNKCNMCQACEDAHTLGGDAVLDQIIRNAKKRRARESIKKERERALRFKQEAAIGRMTLKSATVFPSK